MSEATARGGRAHLQGSAVEGRDHWTLTINHQQVHGAAVAPQKGADSLEECDRPLSSLRAGRQHRQQLPGQGTVCTPGTAAASKLGAGSYPLGMAYESDVHGARAQYIENGSRV